MAKKYRRGATTYPAAIGPRDLLHFIELKWFTVKWDALNLPDEELGTLQVAIMCNPKAGAVIKGTKGLRKLRFSPSSWSKGKSGALRICYVHFDRFYTVLLAAVYPKSENDDLSADAKRKINILIERVEAGLENLFQKREDERRRRG